ncbi:unnamed protein product, partial [Heterobilharzia americana]
MVGFKGKSRATCFMGLGSSRVFPLDKEYRNMILPSFYHRCLPSKLLKVVWVLSKCQASVFTWLNKYINVHRILQKTIVYLWIF